MLDTSGDTQPKVMTVEVSVHITDEKQWLLRVAERYPDVCKHIIAGRRSVAQLGLLLQAMQLFHEDRLGAVMSSEVDVKKLPKEQVHAFCDMLVADADVPDDVKTALLACGIRLCGELFRFWWNPEWKVGATVRALMVRHKLPFQFDPWHFGWRPTYLQDPVVLNALQASAATICKVLSVWQPYPCSVTGSGSGLREDEQYIGAYLARPFAADHPIEYRLEQCRERHHRVASVHPSLHGAMYFERCWPEGLCPELAAYLAVRERARVLRAELGRSEQTRMSSNDLSQYPPSDIARRRTALVNALRAENMSPHFFDEVVMRYASDHVNYHRIGGGGVHTVRALLCSSRRAVEASSGELSDYMYPIATARLAYWGLGFMSTQEFDDIFGADAP